MGYPIHETGTMIKDIFYLVHNRKDVVKETFPKLRETVKPPYKLWVIDNGSTIKDIEKITASADHYKKFPRNIGIAAAINEMTKLSTEKYFIYVESDCLVHQNWVYDVERELKEHELNLAWMGFKILKKDGTMAFFYRNMNDEGESLEMPSSDPRDPDNNGINIVDAPCNVLSVFNTEALRDVGGINENLIGQWIDSDLGMRLKQKKWKCIANGKIEFIHTHDHKETYRDVVDHDLFKNTWSKKPTNCKICNVKLEGGAMSCASGTICMKCFNDINDASMQPNQFAPNVLWTLAEVFFKKGKGEEANFKDFWENNCNLELVDLRNLMRGKKDD